MNIIKRVILSQITLVIKSKMITIYILLTKDRGIYGWTDEHNEDISYMNLCLEN